jgi:signal transduction histidine kinase
MQPPGWQEGPSERKETAGEQADWAAGEVSAVEADRLFAREVGRYEDFLRSSVDWLWETDARLVLTYASSPVALKLGIPAQVLIGRPLPSLGRFDSAGAPARSAQAAIEACRPFRNAAFVMTGAGDREVTYRLSGVPYFDENTGTFAGYRGAAVAVSRAEGLAEAEEQETRALAQTLEETLIREQELTWRLAHLKEAPQSEQRDQAVGENPLARTAHELRTPLNAIVGYADLALKGMFGPLGERYVDCFRTIREAGRHLDQLVTHLQASGRSSSEEALASEVVEVAAISTKAKAMIALAAQAAEVDISRVGPLAGGRVVGDRMACTQILVNLLSNAVKFTPAGGSIGLETLVGPDNNLQIAVWDTGIGIPKDEQARIFEDSYRASGVTGTGGPAGLGLGLAISRDLARVMGGDITVSSQPGRGARFTLSLPLAAEPTVKEG